MVSGSEQQSLSKVGNALLHLSSFPLFCKMRVHVDVLVLWLFCKKKRNYRFLTYCLRLQVVWYELETKAAIKSKK